MATAETEAGQTSRASVEASASGQDVACQPAGIRFVDLDRELEIPSIADLEDFRRWALSDVFPESGRIDYIAGRIEIDMSPENAFSHGVLKTEIVGVVWLRAKRLDNAMLFSDCMRLSCPAATLSAEPDILLVTKDSLSAGRVRFVPSVNDKDEYVELEGAADFVVEIVSPGSVRKDTVRLPVAYYQAGVKEFWLVDARGEQLIFTIHGRGASGFEPVPVDSEGFQLSSVMNCRYRLERQRSDVGYWKYDLQEREPK